MNPIDADVNAQLVALNQLMHETQKRLQDLTRLRGDARDLPLTRERVWNAEQDMRQAIARMAMASSQLRQIQPS